MGKAESEDGKMMMKPVKIAVVTKEVGLAHDVARGLSELGKGISVVVIEPETGLEFELGKRQNLRFEGADAVVTDLACFGDKMGCRTDFEPSEVVYLQECGYRISEIYNKVMEVVCLKRENDGEPFQLTLRGGDEKCRMMAFFGKSGGCGVTSVAMTAGRLLAGIYGESVLYVGADGGDSETGADADGRASGGSDGGDGDGMALSKMWKELQYRIKNDRTIYAEKFVQRDDYGLEYLQTGAEHMGLLDLYGEEFWQKLAQRCGYKWIFFDLGKRKSAPSWTIPVEIFNYRDVRDRHALEYASGIRIVNRVDANFADVNCADNVRYDGDKNGAVFQVADDEDSFSYGEISLSKNFAAGVRDFAGWLMEE